MAKPVSLYDRLTNAKKSIEIAPGEVYDIDDRRDTVIKANELFKSQNNDEADMALVFEVNEILLGKDAIKAIEKAHPGYTTRLTTASIIMQGIFAALNDKTLEDIEEATETFLSDNK